jgi:hypothetical protein
LGLLGCGFVEFGAFTMKRSMILSSVLLAGLWQTTTACADAAPALKIGPACVLHMPGELFVEYQLAAQKMRPEKFVCLAAYGDAAPTYIGTSIAYSQGGYKPTRSRVAPEVEDVLLSAMGELLAVEDSRVRSP